MERPPGVPPRVRTGDLDVAGGGAILPSRRAALDQTVRALAAGKGLVILTGGPGVGKTWLTHRLRDETPATWRWIGLDLSENLGIHGLYRLILRGLGRSFPATLDAADARVALDDALAESSLDGFHWGLLLDEAQNAIDAVLEEIRLFTNRVSTPEGFAGVVLVGQSGLALRLARPPLLPLQSRAAARVHLRPFGINETVEFLRRCQPGAERTTLQVERLHRSVGGNPRALGLAVADSAPALRLPTHVEAQGPRLASPLSGSGGLTTVVPVRPPLKVGDGMVEVGWEPPDGDDDDAEGVDDEADWREPVGSVERNTVEADPAGPSAPAPSALDEPIDDHYAALQAWGEWTRNRATAAGTAPDEDDAGVSGVGVQPAAGAAPDDAEGAPEDPTPETSFLRAEAEHGFAPYSQLFSRVKPARDLS